MKKQGKIRAEVEDYLSEGDSADWEWHVLKELVTHSHVKVTDDFVMLIKRSFASSTGLQYHELNFKECYLPDSEWHETGMTFADRPKFAIWTVLAVQNYLQRLTEISKTTTEKAFQIAGHIVKFFEYCWLEEIYDPRDISDQFWLDTNEKLIAGGWGKLLRIQERITALVDATEPPELFEFLGPPFKNCYSIRTLAFQRALQTNAPAEFLAPNAENLYAKVKLNPRTKVFNEGYPPSHPVTAFDNLQAVANLALLPHPYTVEAAANVELCRPATPRDGRTRNLQVEDVAEILASSMIWIEKVGPIVCGYIEKIAVGVANRKLHGLPHPGKEIDAQLAPMEADIAKIFPDFKVSNRDMPAEEQGAFSLREVVLILLLACFMVIGGLNARRRDEISSWSIGICRGDLKIEDEVLGVYSMAFYLEKSLRDYKRFYVGRATYLAISLLNRLFDAYLIADIDHDSSVDHRRDKLFTYRRLSKYRGIAKEPSSFSVEEVLRQGMLKYLLNGKAVVIEFKTHTLRRFYAIYFYYRFEHGTLQALAFQMGESMAGVLVYITDPSARDQLEAIDAALSGAPLAARLDIGNDLAATLKAFQKVGQERLEEIISKSLAGKVSGGYPKYIRLLDLRLSKSAVYRTESLDERVRVLRETVASAGHWPKPGPNGDCMAGGQRAAKLAHCATDGDGVKQENASPATCAKCPFSYVSRGYYDHMKNDLLAMKGRVLNSDMNDFERARLDRQIHNLTWVITLHASRMEISE